MANYKVVLEFHYDSEEDVSGWNVDVDFDNVTCKEDAITLAREELLNGDAFDFEMTVEEM